MKKLLCAFVVAATMVPALAFADGGDSCAAAQPIAPSSNYSGDTSTSTNFVSLMGVLPSPGPDQAYKFTSDGQVTSSISVTGSFNFGAFLLASCGTTTAFPIESVAASSSAGGTVALPIDNGSGGALTAGTTYYVIISGNPSDNSGPAGAYSFSTPTPLPVTLQQFSID